MHYLPSEKILKTLWHYENHWYLLKKEGDPNNTPEAPHIEKIVFQRQIHLLLQIGFG